MNNIEADKIGGIYKKEKMQRSLHIDGCDEQKKILEWVLLQQESKEIAILDAGCGNGRYSNYLNNKGYINTHSIDLFDEAPSAISSLYKKSSIDNTPYPDNYFNVIFSFSVIYYLNNPETGFIEFNRLLERGGRLLITAHTKYSLFTLWRIIKRKLYPKSVEHLVNVKFYSASDYSDMLDAAGFDVVYVDGFRLSPLHGRVYSKLRNAVQKILSIKLPCFTMKISNNKLLKLFRARFGYHSVIVAVRR